MKVCQGISHMKASIIIRTLNEEKHIGNLLAAINKQTHRDYEIILVDSGSSDRTMEIARPHCDVVTTIESRDFTFGYSLNEGCKRASGDVLIITSAHAYPADEHWLAELVAPFCDPDVAMAYGRQVGARETKHSERNDFERIFGSIDTPRHSLPYFANNANAAVRAELWKEEPFDAALTGLEDIAWARHWFERGKNITYVATASVHHIHEEVWPQVYNRYRREAIAARRMGLPEPPMASINPLIATKRALHDFATSPLRTWATKYGMDILRFRFEQWRGSHHGWHKDSTEDLPDIRTELFYSSMTNYGVRIESPGQARLTQLPVPEVKPGDVLIRVAYTGICATDLEVYEGTLGYYKTGRASYPIVPGHEFSGTIARVGARVTDLAVGDPVVGECIQSCRRCAHCKREAFTACPDRIEVGVMNKHGSYAQYVVVPAVYVHKLPAGVPLSRAALVEPLAVVLRGVRRLEPFLKEPLRVGVVGAGPIGNLAAQVLSHRGHDVTVFERNRARRAHLPDSIATKADLYNVHEYDILVEATGNRDALQTVLRDSRVGATALLLGFPYGSLPYNFEEVVGGDRVIIGSVGGSREDFIAATRWLVKLDCTAFHAGVFPLVEFETAWNAHREGKFLKTMLAL